MLTYNYDHASFTFKSVRFNYKNVELEIPIKYYDIHGIGKYSKGIANIFENVRKRDDKKFSNDENPKVVKFLEQITRIDINDIEDNIMILKSSVSELDEYIKIFADRILNYKNVDYKKNISNSFSKKETAQSITLKELSDDIDDDYFFNQEIIEENIASLLIIDDTINKGRTLNQFLIRLVDANKISTDTKISLYVIYVFTEVQKFSLDEFSKLLSNSENDEDKQ